MSKAIVFTDLHLHRHKDRFDRLEDCLRVLNWIFETAKEKEAKYIFFLGDLFHERSNIDILNYLETFEVFMHHMITDAQDIDLYLLVGNHDMYHKKKWRANSIKPLTAIPRCHIIESPTTTIIDGRRIDWLPHTDNPLESVTNFASEGKSLLFAHISIDGAFLNSVFGTRSDVIVEYDNEMIPVNSSLFTSWEHVYMGHYHGAQKIGDNMEYIGSPLQLSFGEAFQKKHILLLDLETLDVEYIENNFSPVHLMVTPEDIRDENYSLDGNFVRVIVNEHSVYEVIDLRKEIESKYNVLSLDFKVKDKKSEEEEEAEIEEAKSILFSEGKMLETYVQETGVPKGLDREHLLKVGEKCLT